jgi:hypothetical protein
VESIDEVIVGPSHLDQIQACCMQKKHLNSFCTLFDSLHCKLSLLSWLIFSEGMGLEMKIHKQCLENSYTTVQSWRSSRIAHATWNAVKG